MSASEASTGLVYSSTSGTRPENNALPAPLRRFGVRAFHRVDRKLTRLRSMKHNVITAARLNNEAMTRGGRRFRAAFITLTYAPGNSWNGRHISNTLAACRMWHTRLGLRMRYVWVAEMQQRGAVHYHIILWLPYGYTPPKFDQRGWWPHGASNSKWARNAVGYIAKYASKGQEGAPGFPRGIRIQGVGGLDLEGRRVARWWRQPTLCRVALGESADIRRINGGRFDAVTGLFWASPWRYVLINGIPTLLNTSEAQPCFN